MENVPNISKLQEAIKDVKYLEYLDQGGFKAVYKGTIKNNTEAIKIVYIPTDIDNEGLREEIIGRTQRELESLNKCKSEYIVRLGSINPKLIVIEDHQYIVYSEEFLEGENLRSKIKQGYKPDFVELTKLAKSLFEAILILKSNELIHRDIKPDNVIALHNPKRPFVILDLGIAFKLHGTSITRDSRYRPGTLPYMAPEMFNTSFRDTLDYRSDLYSAGITLYEYASGKHPIAKKREDDFSTMYRILKTIPLSLYIQRSDLPEDFCKIVDQLIKKIPALRPASIELLLNKLKGL